MGNNLDVYNALRGVPKEAKKEIAAGRLKGFTDINPMWRIKRLTEVFGPCGIGWWYIIKDKRLEGDGSEIRAFVDVDLYYKWGDVVSQPIPGTGGSSFVTQERNGIYTSDECYKMALTDALSVAAKSIGLGADVYYEKDRDKYTIADDCSQNQKDTMKTGKPKQETNPKEPTADEKKKQLQDALAEKIKSIVKKEGNTEYAICENCGDYIYAVDGKDGKTIPVSDFCAMGLKRFGKAVCKNCFAELNEKKNAAK